MPAEVAGFWMGESEQAVSDLGEKLGTYECLLDRFRNKHKFSDL